jgi:uncharacterized repeat protein (TIGR01451 family)
MWNRYGMNANSKKFHIMLFFWLLVWGMISSAQASLVNQPMTGGTAPGWVIGGSAFLTASTGIDAPGNGWLRLTDPGNDQSGYAFYDAPFDVTSGAVIQFDYVTYGGSGADGYSIFLFDGSYDATTFNVGASGGSLGYDKKTVAPLDPGLSGGYIGIGVDEYGNYSNPTEGRQSTLGGANAGPFPNEVGVRTTAALGYDWLGGTGTLTQPLWFNQSFRPSQTSAQYRKVVVYLTPVAAPNYMRIDVYMQYGYNQPLTQLLNGLMVRSATPSSVKVGFAASTGGSTNYHEIRNLIIDSLPTDVNLQILKTASTATVRQGGAISYTLTARNQGPSTTFTASNVPIVDTMPAQLTGVTWICTVTGGATCGAASGSGNINTTATLPFNSAAIYTVTGTVNPATPPGTQITNTATLTPPAGITDYNPYDNTASVTVPVTGSTVTVSGTVYRDTNHNGTLDAGETGTSFGTYYAKIYRASDLTTALQSTAALPSSGAYSFTGIPSYDNYVIILSTTNNLNTFDPSFPNTNYIYTSPLNYTNSSVAVGGSNVTGVNFGVYSGTRIEGMVLKDSGINGGISNANDGIHNASETGIAGVTVALKDSTGTTTYDTMVTGSDGKFSLYTNTGSTTLRVYETNLAGYVSVNDNPGTMSSPVYTIGGEYISFAYTRYTEVSGIVFSDVPDNAFTVTPLAQSGTSATPVYYAHTFTPGSGGSVNFAVFGRTRTTWAAPVIYRDTACNGVYNAVTDPVIATAITASAGVPVCIIVKESILAGATAGTTDVITTQASFTYTNSIGPVVRTYNVVDTTTVVAPSANLSTSTKTWIDTNGGDQNPGDVIQYTITLNESNGSVANTVSVTDNMPANITNFAVVSIPAGATNSSTYAGTGTNSTGYLNITGITVPASGTVTIVFYVTIAAGTTSGTLINNTATITIPAGTGATPAAPVLTVAASTVTGSGNKPLYLYDANSTPTYKLSRTRTPSGSAVAIAPGTTRTWTESPVLQGNVTISPTVAASCTLPLTGQCVKVPLYLSTSTNGSNSTTVSLNCSSGGTTLTQTQPTLALTTTAQIVTFDLQISAALTCLAGNSWVLTVTNGSANTTTVYPVSGVNVSNVSLPSLSVISVSNINYYSAAYPVVTAPAFFIPGSTVYVRAVITDPFGSYDVTSATVLIKDPNNLTRINNAIMTQVADSGLATKTFEYLYNIPAVGPSGFWTVSVTGNEGSEGAVTNTLTNTFGVYFLPSLTFLKTVAIFSDPVNGTTNPKFIPGAQALYTLIATNSSAGSVDNNTVVITDPIPANTMLYVNDIGVAGSGPVAFSQGATTSGLTYTKSTDLSYSNDSGSTWVATPVANAAGCDPAITNIRINPKGVFVGNGASFNLTFRVCVK